MTPQFKDKVERFGPRFKADLGLTNNQVAGIFGNLAVESDQFRALQEYKPTVKGSKGGLGWAQWTGMNVNRGGRRGLFEAWCRDNGVSPADDEANYGFMLHELRGAEAGALAALKRTRTLDSATTTFMTRYERPGVPHEAARKARALEALQILETAVGTEAVVTRLPPARPKPAALGLGLETASDGLLNGYSEQRQTAQEQLADAGFTMVGRADGKPGPRTTAGLVAFQEVNGLPITRTFDELTMSVLAGRPKKMPISLDRAAATAKDVAKTDTSVGSIVRHANKILTGAASGAIGLPTITALIDPIQQIREFFATIPPIAWALLGSAVLTFVIWQVWSIRAKSVAAHRIGETA